MNKFSKFTAHVICELHPLFRGLIWVAAARSTDETRPVLMDINIEREGILCHIVATDGRRLHHHTFDPGLFDSDIDMIEPGQYEVIAKTAKLIVIAPCEESYNYPNWRQVIPDYTPDISAMINSQTISKIGIMTGVLLAADFVNDAIGFKHGQSKDATVGIRLGSSAPGGAFVITHELGKAIVMPLRMDDQVPADEAKTDVEMTSPLPGFERGPLPESDGATKACKKFVDGIKEAGMSVTISTGGKSVTIDGTKQATKTKK